MIAPCPSPNPVGTEFYLSNKLLVPTGEQAHFQSGASGTDGVQASYDAWRRSFDWAESRIVEWWHDPDSLYDDETDPPDRDTIGQMWRQLSSLKSTCEAIRSQGRMTTFLIKGLSTGTGGSIHLYLSSGPRDICLVVYDKGHGEWLLFTDGSLVERRAADLG